MSDDISDLEPLTPSHILHGRRLARLPHEGPTSEEVSDPSYLGADQLRREARKQLLLLEHCLTSLREFYRPSGRGGQITKVGDVVLVHNDGARINWKLAVVQDLVKGNDGLVRSATIRTSTGVTNRPITKLYPLEVAVNDAASIRRQVTEGGSDQDDQEVTSEQQANGHPKRGAAERAQQRILEWTGCARAPPPRGCRRF